MRKVLMTAVMVALAMGCKSKSSSSSGGDKADKAGEGAAVKLPPLTADPDPGAITAADKAPFESVKFRQLAERSDKGWPKYDVYNLGNKPIVFMALYGYAYDKDGNQVAHTATPLSWNGNIKPGSKSDWDISIGGFPEDQVPATAASYELCFDSIKFDGDKDSTDQRDRCPEKKPKGK